MACCCPCVVVGWNWQSAKLGRFIQGCLPVGCVFVLFILFIALPYITGGGPCSVPQFNVIVARFFTGECTSMEYPCYIFAALFWVGFALLLNYCRRRIADQLGIAEKPCPSLIGQCCCCYACLLSTEMQTLQQDSKSIEARKGRVGDCVLVGAV